MIINFLKIYDNNETQNLYTTDSILCSMEPAQLRHGNVEIIKNTPLGDLIVILSGEEAHIDQALAYLKAHEVGVEVMKSC